MDILVSAIVGDLISRSASFVISKYFQQQPGIDRILQRLQSVLQRIDIIVEEAEARHITNQAMLRQLKMLRQGMYRGNYVLDALSFQASLDEKEGEEEMSHSSSALSKSSSIKRLRFSRTRSGSSNREALLFGTNSNMREELQQMMDTLEDTVADLAVLPIVGPIRVGKSTLVENICRDESVRDRFSMILFFPEGSLKDEGVISLRESNIKFRHQNFASRNRFLIIIEIAKDINEETWRRLKYSATCMTPCGGSKIIITSRSDRIVNLGTTEALRLDYLSQEAYWHFFKSIAFGSRNPGEHPKLATMAMEIALEQRQCFSCAHIIAGLLQLNFNAQFWRAVLECVRATKQTHLLMFDQNPYLRLREDAPVYCWRLVKSCRYFLICDYHQSDSSESVPKITIQDIMLGRGGTLPSGKFEALGWRSRIPPYYNYMISCKMQEPQLTVGKKKRAHQEEEQLI